MSRLLLLFWLFKRFRQRPSQNPLAPPEGGWTPCTFNRPTKKNSFSPHLSGSLLGSLGITSRCQLISCVSDLKVMDGGVHHVLASLWGTFERD